MPNAKILTINNVDYDLKDEKGRLATAAEFSTSTSYAVGDYCWYDNKLYRFTTAHSSSSWVAAHATEVKITDEIKNIDVGTDTTLSIAGKPADAKATGDALIEVDATLSTTGKAADAKKTGDEITELKTDIEHYTGNAEITGWVDGKFIGTSGTTANPSSPTTSASWRYVIVNCAEGDQFTINGVGKGTPRLWAFCDSSNNILANAAGNTTGVNLVITAPASTSYLILNSNEKVAISYKGVFLEERVSSIDTIISHLTDESYFSFSVSANGGLYVEMPVVSSETIEFNLLSVTGNYSYVQAYLFKADNTYTNIYNPYGENKWYQGDTVRYTASATYARFRCYAFVTSGTVTVTFAVYKVNDATYTERIKLLEGRGLLNRYTCKIFKKVVCCGDSYTAGHINESGGTQHPSNPEFAWPHYMETLTGNTWYNCGISGANCLTWQSNSDGLAKAQASGKSQAYVIGLGLNDEASDTERYVPVGTSSDIGTATQSYYGGISAIIRALATVSPDAFIFVLTNPNITYADLPARDATSYNAALRDIVSTYENSYNVHLIDLAGEYAYLFKNPSLLNGVVSRHFTATGYEQFAEILAYVFSDYINKNVADFNAVAFIDYDT